MMARMGWGMEDPAAEARRRLGRDGDATWGESAARSVARDGLLVLLFVVLAAGGLWWGLQRADEAAADDPATAVIRGEVTGLGPESLARPANLRQVLAEMAGVAAPADRLVSLRVAPAWVQATMVAPTGDEYFLDRRVGREIQRRPFARTNRSADVTLADVRPADVARAVNTVARTGGIPVDALDHLVLSWSIPRVGQTISVHMSVAAPADRSWVGTGNGSRMRRSSSAPAASAPAAGTDQREQLRVAECVLDAGGDIARIRQCMR